MTVVELWIVDDNEDDRLLLRDALTDLCDLTEIHLFSRARAVIDHLDGVGHNGRCNGLLFLDMAMPGMSGRELLEELESRSWLPHVRFVLVSGNDPRDIAQVASEFNALGYVRKQDTFEELLDGLRSLPELLPLLGGK